MPLFMADARPPSGHWHERFVAGLVTGAAFALPAFSLGLPSGYSWGALMLVLAGFVALFSGGARTCWQLSHWRWFSIAVALMGLVWLLRIDIDWGRPLTIEAFGRIAKYALALIAIAAVCRKPPPIGWLKLGCWTGAWFAGLTAAWQIHVQGMERASGYTNAIQFGDIAVLLAVWSLLWWRNADGVAAKLFAGGAIVAGAYAALASGTRGGWIVAPVLLMLAWLLDGSRRRSLPSLNKQTWFLWGFAGIASLIAAGVISHHTPQWGARLAQIPLEWSLFREGGVSETSIGHRLAHWQLAWDMGWDRPMLGWSEAGYDREKQYRVILGEAPPVVLRFGHAHHEWLDLWAKGGLAGVGALALFFGIPLLIYIHSLRQNATSTGHESGELCTAAVCGAVLVLGFFGFGMTQVLFAHNSGNMMYLFMNLLWMGATAPRSHRQV